MITIAYKFTTSVLTSRPLNLRVNTGTFNSYLTGVESVEFTIGSWMSQQNPANKNAEAIKRNEPDSKTVRLVN